jgi:RNA polymerase sigma factor (sigma-70 family)
MTQVRKQMRTHTATILVVDDDASVRVALSRLLMSVGYRVETFAGAAEFLERAPRTVRGCIVLDVKMPVTNGFELQRQLGAAGIDLPVIFLSAHVDVPVTVSAMKGGAFEVIIKPFDEDHLLDAVRNAVEQDRMRDLQRIENEQLRQLLDAISPRERTVMSLVVTGMRNKEIAAILGISEKTVKVHRAHVMTKMQASSLPDLVRIGDRLGLRPDIPVDNSVQANPFKQLG